MACFEHEVSNETLIRASDGPLKPPLKTFRASNYRCCLNATVESAVEPASSASAERVEPAVVALPIIPGITWMTATVERAHDFEADARAIDDGFIFTPRLVRLGTVTKDVALWPELLVETGCK